MRRSPRFGSVFSTSCLTQRNDAVETHTHDRIICTQKSHRYVDDTTYFDTATCRRRLNALVSWSQSRPAGKGRHHQHQRRAHRLGQRRERGHKAGRHPADGGEARQRGRAPLHRPRGNRTLTPSSHQQLDRLTNPELALCDFQPITMNITVGLRGPHLLLYELVIVSTALQRSDFMTVGPEAATLYSFFSYWFFF